MDDDKKVSHDVVEIVRCKDCKYRPSWGVYKDKYEAYIHHELPEFPFPGEFKCPCECDDEYYSWVPDDDWFCADGVRRDKKES